MESIKIRVSGDENYGYIIEAVAPVLVEKTALSLSRSHIDFSGPM